MTQGATDRQAPVADFALQDALLAGESCIRLAAFAGVFALMALWELVAPRRRQASGAGCAGRAISASSLVDTLARPAPVSHRGGRVAPCWRSARAGACSTSSACRLVAHRSRLRSSSSTLPSTFSMLLSMRCRRLWRLHRMHHADLEFDVTTGVALPPDRDPAFDADQARRRRRARRVAARRS